VKPLPKPQHHRHRRSVAGIAVSADGTTIAGTYTDIGWTYTYSFTREE